MSEVLSVVVVMVSVLVLLAAWRGAHLVDSEGRPIRLRGQRRFWLAPALFFLTFAVGDCLVLLIYGGVIKHLGLIVPAVFAAASCMYMAKSPHT